MNPIKPEKAQQLLNKAGLNVSIEQATAILLFLNNLADIAITVYLSPDN